MNPWLVVASIGVGTYALRVSFIAILGRTGVPPWLARALRFVAPAVFGALVAPAVLIRDGGLDLGAGNPRFAAAAVAALIAWRTKNVALTIAVGMVVLWALQAF